METKDKLQAWRIFAKAVHSNNQVFNVSREWQKTHLLHLAKCLDNIKKGLPPPANHELADMETVKRLGISLTEFNNQPKNFTEQLLKKPEKHNDDCGCMFCNPWKNQEQHLIRALKKVENNYKFISEKQPAINLESPVFSGLQKMFEKPPSEVLKSRKDSRSVHKTISTLFEKYGPF